ncbi:tripartite-type tricarboxylate transporter receptor subunit TctC [Streptomyces africanus]|uniref:Tripartite-type tricarboxylate transporter receptor subunit TctC n=1 Tax=Streptomyces africanus TaxID=231024 RepID=A0ABU0QZT4_9ACTN|nr:tripartite-type tricarboxylate transporter receptor subunit TctC [Streptomyces africanus]
MRRPARAVLGACAALVLPFDLPGAGGTVGLKRLADERGNGALALQMGLGVVGAAHAAGSRVTVTDTTPIARLVEESGAIVVRKDSPYRTIGALVDAWRADPGSIRVGGGSSVGGPDHLLPMRLAQTVGIDPRKVAYVAGRTCSPPAVPSSPVWPGRTSRSPVWSAGSGSGEVRRRSGWGRCPAAS